MKWEVVVSLDEVVQNFPDASERQGFCPLCVCCGVEEKRFGLAFVCVVQFLGDLRQAIHALNAATSRQACIDNSPGAASNDEVFSVPHWL